MSRMKLPQVLAALEEIAPLSLAEDWDNVGLLLEPKERASVKACMLTIDLTRPVYDEAVKQGCDLIVSYHPPIFSGLKRLTRQDAQQAILLDASRRGIAIYAPHTALDAAMGGVNDWLMDGLGVKGGRPNAPTSAHRSGMDTKIVIFVPDTHVGIIRDALVAVGCGHIGDYSNCSFELEGQGTFRGGKNSKPVVGVAEQLERVEEIRLEMVCRSSQLGTIDDVIRSCHPYEEAAWDAYALRPKPSPRLGQGRHGTFTRPLSVNTLVKKVKGLLGLSHVRLAVAKKHEEGALLESVALCAGAGASVLLNRKEDFILTGEMRHHDVLAFVARGQTVVLCDHSNTERGFLSVYAERLKPLLAGVEVYLSKSDRDPLVIV